MYTRLRFISMQVFPEDGLISLAYLHNGALKDVEIEFSQTSISATNLNGCHKDFAEKIVAALRTYQGELENLTK